MRKNDEEISDPKVIGKLSNPKFNFIIIAIEEYKDLYYMSLELIMGSLYVHE